MQKGSLTEFLLKSVSSRLSGREDCKGINYEVIIDHKGVRMSPLIYVYPNRHKRHDSDKIDIVSFIHSTKMKDTPLSELVFGKYKYESSFDNKKRKWVKIL